MFYFRLIILVCLTLNVYSSKSTELAIAAGKIAGNKFATHDLEQQISVQGEDIFQLSYSWPYSEQGTVGQGRIMYNQSTRRFVGAWNNSFDDRLITRYLHFGGVAFYRDGNQITTFDLGIGGLQFVSEQSGYDTINAPSIASGVAARYYLSDYFGVQVEGRVYASLVDAEDALFCQAESCQARFKNDFWLDSQVTLGIFWSF
jgi:hypothetical protein